MDRHFLEFWGNLLIYAARGQKQMEEIKQWIHKDFKGFEDLRAMFLKFYGLEKEPADTPKYQNAWEEASRDFLNSFNEYLKLMGVVSRADYQDLSQKYEKLKKQSNEQERIIGHLRMLLAEKLIDPTGMAENFQELIREQSNHFQKLMQGFDMVLNTNDGKDRE